MNGQRIELQELRQAIEFLESKAVVVDLGGTIICGNYPHKLEETVIDYIDCRYKITHRENSSVTFEIK